MELVLLVVEFVEDALQVGHRGLVCREVVEDAPVEDLRTLFEHVVVEGHDLL